jgi:uncharacterized damage-inducible protein DinB
MQTKWPWFERSFDFDFPASKLPDIVERLLGTPLRAARLVDGLQPDVLNWRDGPTWSIQENIGHLADVEPLWIGRVQDLINGQPVLRAADLTNAATSAAHHHRVPVAELLLRFERQRREFVQLVEELTEDQWSLSALHPRLQKPMRVVDLCLFAADHDDYHLARIRYLKNRYRRVDA